MPKNTKDNILWVLSLLAAIAGVFLGLPPLFYYMGKYFLYWQGK